MCECVLRETPYDDVCELRLIGHSHCSFVFLLPYLSTRLIICKCLFRFICRHKLKQFAGKIQSRRIYSHYQNNRYIYIPARQSKIKRYKLLKFQFTNPSFNLPTLTLRPCIHADYVEDVFSTYVIW